MKTISSLLKDLYNYSDTKKKFLSIMLSLPKCHLHLSVFHYTMMQETANENAAGVRRICQRSYQPKIEI